MSFDKLKGKMTERHVSQEKLAKVLGITVQSLNAKLNGRSQFTLEEVVKISEHLKLDNPVDIFLTRASQKCNDHLNKKRGGDGDVEYYFDYYNSNMRAGVACDVYFMHSIDLLHEEKRVQSSKR